MFYRMLNTARGRWYSSKDCTVNNLIDYIIKSGQMRDAQIEAIKTYLFLKIGCDNQPLYYLFSRGRFNNLDLNSIELSGSARAFLEQEPAAAALYEYASMKDAGGKAVSAALEKQMRKQPEAIDSKRFFKDAFYGVTYTDYLFSLPMGAGKTYLMAAFIYLDLYFAMREPANPAFAHNFIIFAPSGLKSSVVPSLKTIQNFNPTWVLPEPSASEVKRRIVFEVLDQSKTTNKSNKIKNPNVQKIANHQPFKDLMGLVLVTNAEKVILDRIQEKNGQINMFELSDDDKDRQANELRNLIGKLPSLSIFIDEVHHAVTDEIKLRAVVNQWTTNKTVNSVIGFSGTPYLDKAEKITVIDKLAVAATEISNIVYYYPLIMGIGNFLKKPIVKIATAHSGLQIIEQGVRKFLENYKDKVYEGGLTAKLGIYCGTIEKLEEQVYPLVSGILTENGMSSDVILKYHKGNKIYPQPVDSQMQFEILDKSISKIRIILLVQIGKEGWDCRSLTGIILSQEGDCPKNMVLQTSCRCLRQVEKFSTETALIYLNDSNAKILNAQLQQQQHISLKEFSVADHSDRILKRYDRTAYLKLPPIDYYQLIINYETLIIDSDADTANRIKASTRGAEYKNIIKTTDFEMKTLAIELLEEEKGNVPASFSSWLYHIARSGFGFITMEQLKAYSDLLSEVFYTITYEREGSRYYSSGYKKELVEANIRKAFYERRSYVTKEELIPYEAELLNIANFHSKLLADSAELYYPDQKTVENIILDDKGSLKPDSKTDRLIKLAEETGNDKIAEIIRKDYTAHPAKNHSFHYLPYKTDSAFEQTFMEELLRFSIMKELGLELYYNGDRSMTEFKIKCYRSVAGKWRYIGLYTPDFLVIKRKEDKIHKVMIVETKGRIFANDPGFTDKRSFMETEFKKQNNTAYGYRRFEYLYLEDSLEDKERILKTHKTIREFFEED